jgi:hypothetical protein
MVNPIFKIMEEVSGSDWVVTGSVISRSGDTIDIRVLDILKQGPTTSVSPGQTVSITTGSIDTATIESTDIFCFTDGADHRLTIDTSSFSVPEIKRLLAGKISDEPVATNDEVRALVVGTGRSIAWVKYETTSMYGTDARIVEVSTPLVGRHPVVGETIHLDSTDHFDLGRTNNRRTDNVTFGVGVFERTGIGWTMVARWNPPLTDADNAFVEQLQQDAAQ